MRRVWWVFLVSWTVPLAAWSHASDAVPPWGDAPAGSLADGFLPGCGFSVVLASDGAEGSCGRWAPSTTGATENGRRIWTDAARGLQMERTVRCLSGSPFVRIDSTLINRGEEAVTIRSVCLADWSFRLADSADRLRYQPLVHRDDRWYGSTYWSGPDWTRVGKDWHHPGTNTPSVRRFVAPRDGRVTVTGRVFKLHRDGDGVRVAILHQGRTVWEAEIEGGDGRGVEPRLRLDVRRGDALRFVVHKRGKIYCDTTGWDPVVTYEDGQRFQASRAFAAKRQGAEGWWYEMDVSGSADIALPQLHQLGRDMVLGHVPLASGRATQGRGTEGLPVWILSDGSDGGGLVLAADGPCRAICRLDADAVLRLRVVLAKGPRGVGPGESKSLPSLLVAPYRGPWLRGIEAFQQLLERHERWDVVARLAEKVDRCLERATRPLETAAASSLRHPTLSLAVLVHDEWRREDGIEQSAASYEAAVATHLPRARQLLEHLRSRHGRDFLTSESRQLEQLARIAARSDLTLAGWRRLYHRLRWLKRHIALSNPLVQLDRLLFCKRVPTSYSHLVMQYYGWRARPGGGLFVLERPGYSLACRDILDGKLARGNVLEPRLSYDARRIVFSYVECPRGPLDAAALSNEDPDVGFYHIYEVNVDGSGLRQLTFGSYDDLMPAYLPDGGIAFCSTRRRGYARCFGPQFSRRWDVYTLHRMDADGRNLRALSFHDTNEWFPAVSNSGHILYARWDYIDRDAVTHQTLWSTRPDGTSPVSVWGNATPKPHCTFQIQPVPGSQKIIFTASAHHSITAGSLVLVDPTISDNGPQALTRLTPEVPFPEAETRDIRQYYAAPWPLSEDYYLTAYSFQPLVWEPGANPANALGIYLLDRFGNRELIYRDPEIGSTNPCPLAPRPKPPVVCSTIDRLEQSSGEMLVVDVYQGLGPIPRGRIKELRIVQVFPKTTPVANQPPIGAAGEENGRAILGTVPVEADGSARFIVPAGKPILFQALDEEGFAYQTMRSVTYVQAGERISCVGCHESRRTAPPRARRTPLALNKPPARIDPGPLGGRPFSYVAIVQPILEKHCVRCHGTKEPAGGLELTDRPEGPFTASYVALTGDVDFHGPGTNPENAARALVPRFGARNQIQRTPPGGTYGARGSRLIRLLRRGHYDVELSAAELRRLGAWIDLNAIFYGLYLPEEQTAQRQGRRLPLPAIQ